MSGAGIICPDSQLTVEVYEELHFVSAKFMRLGRVIVCTLDKQVFCVVLLLWYNLIVIKINHAIGFGPQTYLSRDSLGKCFAEIMFTVNKSFYLVVFHG